MDFSSIDLLEMKSLGISIPEVQEVLGLANTRVYSLDGDERVFYAIGYIDGKKFVHIAYKISVRSNFDLDILQVGIPNGEDIKRYWCK